MRKGWWQHHGVFYQDPTLFSVIVGEVGCSGESIVLRGDDFLQKANCEVNLLTKEMKHFQTNTILQRESCKM